MQGQVVLNKLFQIIRHQNVRCRLDAPFLNVYFHLNMEATFEFRYTYVLVYHRVTICAKIVGWALLLCR